MRTEEVDGLVVKNCVSLLLSLSLLPESLSGTAFRLDLCICNVTDLGSLIFCPLTRAVGSQGLHGGGRTW